MNLGAPEVPAFTMRGGVNPALRMPETGHDANAVLMSLLSVAKWT